MYSASDLKKGLKIQIDGQPWQITEFEFCKPGKGTALYRCRLRNMINGSGMEKTYRPTDRIEKPDLEEREMYYSYNDGHHYVFSDVETYEEMSVDPEVLGKQAYFLLENSLCKFLLFNGEPIEIGFNFRYLLDILAQVKSDTVQMYLQDGTSPVILQDEADDNALYVLMPMRV